MHRAVVGTARFADHLGIIGNEIEQPVACFVEPGPELGDAGTDATHLLAGSLADSRGVSLDPDEPFARARIIH
jgi:hypothetical protein